MIIPNYSMITNNSYQRNQNSAPQTTPNFTGLFSKAKDLAKELTFVREALTVAKASIEELTAKLAKALDENANLKKTIKMREDFKDNFQRELINENKRLDGRVVELAKQIDELKMQHAQEIAALKVAHGENLAPYKRLEELKPVYIDGEVISPDKYLETYKILSDQLPDTEKSILTYLENPQDFESLERIQKHVNGLRVIRKGNEQGTKGIALKKEADLEKLIDKVTPMNNSVRDNFYFLAEKVITNSENAGNNLYKEKLVNNFVNLSEYLKVVKFHDAEEKQKAAKSVLLEMEEGQKYGFFNR